MNESQDIKIKIQLAKWINGYIYKTRGIGNKCNRVTIAKQLRVSEPLFCQYTNVKSEKKAPLEFQLKVCFLTGHSIIELHPEYEEYRILHY